MINSRMRYLCFCVILLSLHKSRTIGYTPISDDELSQEYQNQAFYYPNIPPFGDGYNQEESSLIEENGDSLSSEAESKGTIPIAFNNTFIIESSKRDSTPEEQNERDYGNYESHQQDAASESNIRQNQVNLKHDENANIESASQEEKRAYEQSTSDSETSQQGANNVGDYNEQSDDNKIKPSNLNEQSNDNENKPNDYNEQSNNNENKPSDLIGQNASYGNNTDDNNRKSDSESAAQFKNSRNFYSSDSSVVEADKEQLQSVSEFYGDQIIPGDIPKESDIARKMSINEESIIVDQYPTNRKLTPEPIETQTGSTRHRIYSRKQQQLLRHHKMNVNKAIDRHAQRKIASKGTKITGTKVGQKESLEITYPFSIPARPRINEKKAVSQQTKGDILKNGKKYKNIKMLHTKEKTETSVSSNNLDRPKTKVMKTLRHKKQSKPIQLQIHPKHPEIKTPRYNKSKPKSSEIKPNLTTQRYKSQSILSEKKLHHYNNISSQHASTIITKVNGTSINGALFTKIELYPLHIINSTAASKSKIQNINVSKKQPKLSTKRGKVKSQYKIKAAAKKNKLSRMKSKKECKSYLSCLESWFKNYSIHSKSLNSVTRLQKFFNDIYKTDYMISFKSEVRNIVQKLSEIKLINWAITYDYRPRLASWMNIEFLRMPLGIETPANLKQKIVFKRILALKEKQDTVKERVRTLKDLLGSKRTIKSKAQSQIKDSMEEFRFLEESLENLRDNETITEIYQDEAPAISVSGYDRNSYVWSRCAPKEGSSDIYAGMYQKLMDMNSYQCVLYAFMKCVRDMEREDRLMSYRVMNKKKQGSFERYKDGFESLVRLHYDYGANQNKLIPVEKNSSFSMERLTSAYCQSPRDVSCLQEDGVTHEPSIKFEDGYYCQNYFGCYITCGEDCFLRERNLLQDERDRLMTWLSRDQNKRRQAASELWDECCSSNVQNCLPLKPPFQQ